VLSEDLCLNFKVGEVVEIPLQEHMWLPVGSKVCLALCAMDGHCFALSLNWVQASIIEVGKYTLNVLVSCETQVISKLQTFEAYIDIL
jgi:hypothetical protein